MSMVWGYLVSSLLMNLTIRNSNLRQVALWLGIWLFYLFFFSYQTTLLGFALVFATVLVPITMLASYLMIRVYIPKYLLPRKYVQFGIRLIISIGQTTFAVVLVLMLAMGYVGDFTYADLPPRSKSYGFTVILVYLVVAILSYASLWRQQAKASLQNSELQRKLAETTLQAKRQELQHLKNQLQPHFLFNTLNTVYGLALRKADQTPEVILKLSALLDYILYQTKAQQVSLTDELKHLEAYLALEKLRFQDTMEVSFSQNIPNAQLEVPPMLFLPFVENAVKHGRPHEGVLRIEAQVEQATGKLTFRLRNTYAPKEPPHEGIGLSNLRERLRILYPNQHTLNLEAGPQWFSVTLIIPIHHG